MVQFETAISEIIPRVPRVKSFRFKLKEDVDFKPGQFFLVTLKIGGQERTKHFSFSNSPTEKEYGEFTKRITASPFSKGLDGLKVGDWARLKMPYGTFTFEGEYEKIAFLSGGIGITAIRSICKYAADKGLSTDIVLLYGNDKEENIVFRKDLDSIQQANKNFRLVYTLTSPEGDKEKWPGRTGYINDEMIKKEIEDYRERIFYICGPPQMVENLAHVLRNDLGIEEDRIKTENFSGY